MTANFSSVLLLVLCIGSAMTSTCPAMIGAYPHEWNNAAYYRCTNGCPYLEKCPQNTYFFTNESKCKRKPTDWAPLHDLTGRFQSMEIRQSGYDLQWANENAEYLNSYVGQYINDTIAAGIETTLVKRTNCIYAQYFEMFFSIIYLLIIGYGHCADPLPGIDDISSGYDASKMLSINEQNSKYRIFDLSENSATLFKTNVLGKQRTFLKPKLAQVTEISLKKEDSCQTVAYTFESFYKSYFQSISFGIGVSLPGEFAISIGYSETLKQIQQAITKHNKVVGVSSSWWGLYSVQLAPVFLLKFDPMFTESVNLLASEAPNPTTEDDQTYYNQFVEAYGTHYISRVIVGGTANLYTVVDSSFHSTSSYKEITREISFMFQFKQIEGSVSLAQGQIWSSMKESFKSSSSALTCFQPPIESQENKTDWEVWQNKAGDSPVVINRTLSSIHELIRNKPTVREHLRKTINYYLKRGSLPTLAQLNGQNTNRLSLAPRSLGPILGLNVVGCGYDVLMMESKYCVFDQSDFSDGEQWSDPYNKSLAYSLPNGWLVVNTPESLTMDGSIVITSVEDYFRRSHTVTVSRSGGWFGFGQKYSIKTVKEFYRRFYQDYYNLIIRMEQIGWYTLSVRAFPYPKLDRIAQAAIDALPTTFNTSNINIWRDFFNIFGTHIVVSSNMGGQLWAETWYEQCLTYEENQTWINEQIDRRWWFFSNDERRNEYKEKVDQKFLQNSISSYQILGGIESMDSLQLKNWAPTVKANPRPISHRLISMDEMLPESARRKAIKEAIDYILKEAVKEDRDFVSQLESLRAPPQTRCSRNEVRKKRADNKTLDEYMQSGLCPYIGYRGRECLGQKSVDRALIASNSSKMPVGIGMTLDITTGRILLPALQYTYIGNNYWVDPITKTMYQAPRGVSFPPITEKDNEPVARTFMSAAELSNAWKYEKLRGSWLGGEFGHSKSLLDVFNKYFSKNQATAITQKPKALYRLRVENLQLNKYAREAINSLPSVYNRAIYDDFLNTWGTHIVQQALVGGMREQQVLFKDCVFSFNGAITSANLDEYLKKDILTQTLGNSFYADRRKISIDHSIGGDPTEKNETLWQQTLVANPALLKIEEYLPWSDVGSIDRSVRDNLRRVIQIRTKAADKVRIDEEDQLNMMIANGTFMPRDGMIGLLSNGQCEITTATFGSVRECADGCQTRVQIKVSSDFSDNQPLWYFRDETTGFIRARARLDGQTVLDGLPVNAGCSSIQTGRSPTVSAHICVSCTLVNSFANQCVCVCPSYAMSS